VWRLLRIGALRGSDALGERRFPTCQPVYRVSQLVFRLVEGAFRFFAACEIIQARVVNGEHLFFGLDPFAGGINDGGFGICHGPILAGS
jgi:hypothetical protein